MIELQIAKKAPVFLFICFPLIALTQDTASQETNTVFCGNARIVFYSKCHDDTAKKISFVHVHENETTAVKAADRLLDSLQNGCFVTWQSQQQRFVNFELANIQYHFDPNRIYSKRGINKTLGNKPGVFSDSATLAVQKVANAFLKKYIDHKILVVALHNNTNAGGLTINSYQKGGVYSKDASQVYVNPKQDTDDFFYTTEMAYYYLFKSKGFNIVLQDNAGVKDDGSLSVYCAAQKIPYINIEAQDGHLPQQMKMLNEVLAIISRMHE